MNADGHLDLFVAEMSLSDEDPDVKSQAGVVIQNLIEDLEQQAHTRRMAPMTELSR